MSKDQLTAATKHVKYATKVKGSEASSILKHWNIWKLYGNKFLMLRHEAEPCLHKWNV